MIKLDDNLLQELGLGALPPEEKKKMLAHIYETLEMRVGMALAKQMNDGQLNEFEQFIKSNDEAGALRWLETNFPNYRDVVAAEFEKLKAEVKQSAPQILSAATQQAAMPASGQSGEYAVQQPQSPMPQAQNMNAAWPQQPQQYAAPQQSPMPPQGYAQQPYGPHPQQAQPMQQQPGQPGSYGPQPQAQDAQQAAPAQQPYFDPQQGQAQSQAGQSQQQPQQTFDPQQQQATAQPYPPQQPQAPGGYQQ
jgi:hypothetical protein